MIIPAVPEVLRALVNEDDLEDKRAKTMRSDVYYMPEEVVAVANKNISIYNPFQKLLDSCKPDTEDP